MEYCTGVSLLRTSASEQTRFFSFFYDSGVEYQVTHVCRFRQYLRRWSDCRRRCSECVWVCSSVSSCMFAGTAEPKSIIMGEDQSNAWLRFIQISNGIGLTFFGWNYNTTVNITTIFSSWYIYGEPCLSLIPVQKKKEEENKLTHTRNVIICSGFQARKVIKKSSFTEQKERKFISRQILLIF